MERIIDLAAYIEAAAAVVAAILAILSLTAWGRAHAEALRRVMQAVEFLSDPRRITPGTAPDVKQLVRSSMGVMSLPARMAVEEMTSEVDRKKPSHGFWQKRWRILRAALREAWAVSGK